MELNRILEPGQSLKLSDCRGQDLQLIDIGTGVVAAYSSVCPGIDSHNEDSAIVVRAGKERSVLAVADGVGGSRAGHEASQLALEMISHHLSDLSEDQQSDLRPHILTGIEEANAAVQALGVGASCTLALVELNGGKLRTYHIGDSSVLVCGNRGKVKLQTIDHSPTGYGVEGGFIDEKESLFHEERHLVSNVIGQDQMRIEVGSQQRLANRDTIVVASDGLFDNLHTHEIIEQIRSGPLQESLNSLVESCRVRMLEPKPNAPSKPDDLTILVYRQNIPR